MVHELTVGSYCSVGVSAHERLDIMWAKMGVGVGTYMEMGTYLGQYGTYTQHTHHRVDNGESWRHFLDELEHPVLDKPEQTWRCASLKEAKQKCTVHQCSYKHVRCVGL